MIDPKLSDSSRSSPSRLVHSGQQSADPGIAERAARRAQAPYRRPFAAHNKRAFDELSNWRASHAGPLILDAGCGNGESSLALSQRYPEAWVVAVDKTVERLAKRGYCSENGPLFQHQRCCFVLADLVDLWRLLAASDWRFQKQYLLYPNPWPKPGQRFRRWPLHPVWPQLLALSDELELRTNWSIYADEAEQALGLAEWQTERGILPPQPQPLTPFEAKYQDSGHPLYQLCAKRESDPLS